MEKQNLKRAIIYFMYFLISILICLVFFNILPKYNIKLIPEIEEKTSKFQDEVLLKEYSTKEKITLLYFFPSFVQEDLEYKPLKDIMVTVSQYFPETVESKIFRTNTSDYFKIKNNIKLDNTTETFAILIDEYGYVLKIYQEPFNKNDLLKEITYATQNIN